MSSYADANYLYRRQRMERPHWTSRRTWVLRAALVAMLVLGLWIGLARVAYGGGPSGTEHIVVQPGQSLWTIAAARYPDDDTRDRVSQIVELNHLPSASIYPGESLTIPLP